MGEVIAESTKNNVVKVKILVEFIGQKLQKSNSR